MNEEKRRRTVNNLKPETQIPSPSLPKKWKDEELDNLYLSIMKNGHKNLKEIMKNVPYRSESSIKSVLRGLYDSAIKLGSHPNLDAWIKRSEKESNKDTPWKDCLQIAQIFKYLSTQALIESHPSPERCQGVNFLEAYRIIYQCLLGYPIQPVSEPTADFILETIRELAREVKEQKDAIHNVSEFLKKNSTSINQSANDGYQKMSLKENSDYSSSSLHNCVDKPIKVYQKKRKSSVPIPAEVTPVKIVIEEKDCHQSNNMGSKDFSLRIEGDKETVLNVSVPVAVQLSTNIIDQSNMGIEEKGSTKCTNTTNSRFGRMGSNGFSNETSEEIRVTEIPAIVPCYNGKTLKIHEDLVVNGLCAISIKHYMGNCKDDKRTSEDHSKTTKPKSDVKVEKEKHREGLTENENKGFPKTNGDVPECLKDKMKRRNSFWNVHRPELSKLTWPENFVSSAVLQDFFHNHLRIHGTFCEPLHEFWNRCSLMDEEFRDYSKLREIVPPRILPPDEIIVSIMEKSRSVQLNDEDLDPETQVHKSRAEFCVTIGEYVRRPILKRTTSHQMPKCTIQNSNRLDSLPLQREGILSKEAMMSEEKVSAIIGSTDFYLNVATTKKSSKKLGSGIVLRRPRLVDSQRMVATSPPSLNDLHRQPSDQMTAEDSGDPAQLRRVLSPRGEIIDEVNKRYTSS